MAQLDENVWASFVGGMRRWRHENPTAEMPSILGVDSGSVITGWCHFDDEGTICAGEGAPEIAIRDVNALLSKKGPPTIFIREGCFTVSIAQMTKAHDPRKPRRAMITPLSIYRLGVAAGFFTGGISAKLGKPVFWEPPPMTWRSFLKLNKQATEEATARDETAAAVLEYARRKSGLRLETEKEREKIDEANAICMCFAGAHVARLAEREQVKGS